MLFLLPPGEGGAKRRMRVGACQGVDRNPTLTPTPLPEGEGLTRDGQLT